jgi:octaprenyl-diphosphate synthase
MGTVIQLKNQINNSYFQLKESVEDKLVLTEEKIKLKLNSDVELVQKMTDIISKLVGKD